MYFCLVVAKAVIETVDRLSKVLQGEQMTANGGLEAVKATHSVIASLRSDVAFQKFIEVTNFPNAKSKTVQQRKRTAEHAEVLTGSPFKMKLL